MENTGGLANMHRGSSALSCQKLRSNTLPWRRLHRIGKIGCEGIVYVSRSTRSTRHPGSVRSGQRGRRICVKGSRR